MSVSVPDILTDEDLTIFNIQCGITVAETLTTFIKNEIGVNEKIFVRWPNDLILLNKKLGGLLINMITEGEQKREIILGIGINVNQAVFPESLSDIATSLLIVFKKRLSKSKLLWLILKELDKMFLRLSKGEKLGIENKWQGVSYELGKKIEIEMGNLKKVGRALGIGQKGELLLEDENGDVISIFNGYNLRIENK